MSENNKPKRKLLPAKLLNADSRIDHGHVENESRIDATTKESAGRVQEELTPIRRSAGHAHTH